MATASATGPTQSRSQSGASYWGTKTATVSHSATSRGWMSRGVARTLRKVANCSPAALACTCNREGISMDPNTWAAAEGSFSFCTKPHENRAKRRDGERNGEPSVHERVSQD